MYRDFEDLRDNCPVEIKADIAMDLLHADPAELGDAWSAASDGGFRLSLVQAVTDFWEAHVRASGTVPDDGFAIEILVDGFNDPDMGSTLYLDLRAYCGTEEIGELCWGVFADDPLERKFAGEMAARVPALLADHGADDEVRCQVEVTDVEEI